MIDMSELLIDEINGTNAIWKNGLLKSRAQVEIRENKLRENKKRENKIEEKNS